MSNKLEYYNCNGIEAIKDAFYINDFDSSKSYVFLEGRTDEMYFKKAVEVFDHTDLSFEFKWVGHFDKNHEEVNTGCKSLDAAFKFLKGNYPNTKCVCLYDCDTNKPEELYNNIHIKCMPAYENKSKMKKGIENALLLDSLDLKPFYKSKSIL